MSSQNISVAKRHLNDPSYLSDSFLLFNIFQPPIMQIEVLFLLLIPVIVSEEKHDEQFVQFTSIKGLVLKSEFRDYNIIARSQVDCLSSLCAGRLSTCAVSFNDETHECLLSTESSQNVSLSLSSKTEAARDPNWSTELPLEFEPAASSKPSGIRPGNASAMWLLDMTYKGRNLGSKGALLDMDDSSLTLWNQPGPRGMLFSQMFVTMDTSNAATIQILHGDSYALNFSGAFTMACWVKTDDIGPDGMMPIFEGLPDFPGQDFWLVSHQDRLKFRVGPDHYYQTDTYATGRLSWRHIAAVYKEVGNAQFYINATSLTLFKSPKTVPNYQPDSYTVGHSISGHHFMGSMACLTIFEKALSQADVAALMAACPWQRSGWNFPRKSRRSDFLCWNRFL